ncbi:MAG: hypothetical protein EBV73_07250, partial [Rhodocyclales bacterium]|nr:hypothetical protein [Rhodocyclales bacterium]
VMRVQMTPREVAGLQQLAMSYGANQDDLYDPITGEPRFSFLKKILPMVAGAVLGPAGFGLSPFAAAATVGIGYGLIEGDLQKGLMAGLGAYSGGKIGEAFKAAGTPAAPAPTAPATTPAPTPDITAGSATQFPKVTGYGADRLSGMTDYQDSYVPPAPVTQTVQAGTTVKPPSTTVKPPSTFGENLSAAGQGIKNVFASGDAGAASRKAFMGVFDNPISKYATLYGGLAALTPDQKPMNVPGMDETIVYIPGGPNPMYGTGADQPAQLPGKYYKRTSKGMIPYNPYQMAPGYAAGGPVQAADQNMNQQRAIPHQNAPYPFPNQNYPLSTVVQANYQANAPRPREIISGYEAKIDPFTGEEKFAEGGEVAAGQGPDGRNEIDYVTAPTGILPQANNPFAAQTNESLKRQDFRENPYVQGFNIADPAQRAALNEQQEKFSSVLTMMNMNPG